MPTVPTRNAALLDDARQRMKAAQQSIERLINATPSGERRNTLTAINIHLSKAVAMAQGLPVAVTLFEARNVAR